MINVDNGKCIRCSGCVAVCPKAALRLGESGIECNERCTDCGACISFCPFGALSRRPKV